MTFTKEQLISAANARMEFAEMMMTKDLLPLQIRNWSIEAELARIALASLETEPVGYMNRFTGRVFTLEEQPGADTDVQVYMPVYTAPPAPVVPDEAIPQSIEILASTYAPRGVTYQWDKDECNAAADSWNACRAAMLQGAAGNSPAIPDCYDIESFGIFRASEGSSGFIVEIDQFRFGTEKCPQIGKTHMVPKFALQAIINALQQHCDSMEEVPSLAEEVNWEAK